MEAALRVWPHYEVIALEKIGVVDVPTLRGWLAVPDRMNWVFLSTSGIHGSYGALDDFKGDEDDITCLIVQPRLVVMYYGNIKVKREEVPALREYIKQSVEAVRKAQEGNLPKK